MGEESDNQGKPTVLIKTPGNILNNKFLIWPVILLVGIFIGFFLFSIFAAGKPTTPSSPLSKQPVINSSSSSAQPAIQSYFPISTSLLTNPIIYEWQGSIEGKLVKVNPDSYVIQDNKGNNITIFYKTPSGGIWKTLFFNQTTAGAKLITINQIPIGTTLRGSILILKGGPSTPIGSSFSIVK